VAPPSDHKKMSLSNWLALREPADHAARSAALTRLVTDLLPRDRTLRAVDLGTGTGSNVRYLATHLPVQQEWLLVDRDPELLAEAVEALRPLRHVLVETCEMNLGQLDASLSPRRDLVTASALLDLVSDSWLSALAAHCRSAGAVALFTLTYNGRSMCLPVEPEDDMIRELMNQHQRQNDKGFGRAAGPDAMGVAARSFCAAGFHARRDASDWVLPPGADQLQKQLVEGWAQAAREVVPTIAPMIDDWLRRRLEHIAAGRSQITVGHEDLAAWPATG
jgi:Methyltransferase domain